MLTLWLATGFLAKTSGSVELTADGITTDAATLGIPPITVTGLVPVYPGAGQSRTATFNMIPPERRVYQLAADGIETGPAQFGSPSIRQSHVLRGSDLVAAQAEMDAPAMSRTFVALDNMFWAAAA